MKIFLKAAVITTRGQTIEDGRRAYFYCPACDTLHAFAIERPAGHEPCWRFDGNEDAPTFWDSYLSYYTHPETKKRVTLCHLHLKAGRISYLNDCPHRMAGQTIDLPEIPEDKLKWIA